MLSARGSTGDRILGLSEGADDYLPEAVLPGRARRSGADDPAPDRAPARETSPRTSSWSAATWSSTRAGTRRGSPGSPVQLSALELRLLATLLDADGRALTRDQLLDGIHGSGEGDVLDRAIDVYIKRLREKLGDDAERATLRGDGPRRWLSRGGTGRAGGRAKRRRADGTPCAPTASPRGSRSPRSSSSRSRSRSWRSGVMRVGADAFMALMAESGESTEHASEMFASSVTWVVAAAALVAAGVALALGMVLARRIADPIRRLADAAERTAQGDLRATAPVEGPEEVRALANAFNVMVDRLAEQDAIRRDFVVNASHELRTPLTNLKGYLEALRDGVLPPDPATFDSLREEVDRLGRLAASLDLLAGAEGERPMPEDVDLGALVRTGVELARPAFARRSIQVEVAAAPGLVVHARRDEIAQVISNLLQNAARYTPSGGRVEVAAAMRRRRGPGPGHEQRLGDPRGGPAAGLGAVLPRRTITRSGDAAAPGSASRS